MPFLGPEMPLAATIGARGEETIVREENMRPGASKASLRIFNNLQ
jgi:hypothetical protein